MVLQSAAGEGRKIHVQGPGMPVCLLRGLGPIPLWVSLSFFDKERTLNLALNGMSVSNPSSKCLVICAENETEGLWVSQRWQMSPRKHHPQTQQADAHMNSGTTTDCRTPTQVQVRHNPSKKKGKGKWTQILPLTKKLFALIPGERGKISFLQWRDI